MLRYSGEYRLLENTVTASLKLPTVEFLKRSTEPLRMNDLISHKEELIHTYEHRNGRSRVAETWETGERARHGRRGCVEVWKSDGWGCCITAIDMQTVDLGTNNFEFLNLSGKTWRANGQTTKQPQELGKNSKNS